MYNHPIKNKNGQYLATKDQYEKLVSNHDTNKNGSKDYAPVIKLFSPLGAATWLISELNPNTGMMFGLCDLGMGFPELGYVSLEEIVGEWIERDEHIKLPDVPMSKYAELASAEGHITIPKAEIKVRMFDASQWNIKTWATKYQPITNPRGNDYFVENTDWMTNSYFDTIGEDKDYMVEKDITEEYVWTWQEFDGDWILSQGYKFANRLGYFITSIPYDKNDPTEVEITDYDLKHGELKVVT